MTDKTLAEQVAELEEDYERSRMRHEAVLRGNEALIAERDDWKWDAKRSNAEADDAYVERDKAKRAAKYWYSRSLDFGKEWAVEHAGRGVPRVIQPDELREGQTVALANEWTDWKVEEVEAPGSIEYHYGNTTIVLLADAPTDDAYNDTRRLTVHDLNVAPVGSRLTHSAQDAVKCRDERWLTLRRPGAYPAEQMIALGWDTARLERAGD